MKNEALRLDELGHRVLGLQELSKTPAYSWGRYIEERLPRDEIESRIIGNLGIQTGYLKEFCRSVLGFDFDSLSTFERVYPTLPKSNMIASTPRGGAHVYYGVKQGVVAPTRVRIHELDIDLRGQGGYLVAPPSVLRNGKYEWITGPVHVTELVEFPEELLPQPAPSTATLRTEESRPEAIGKAKRYLLAAGGAISGEGGHRKTFRLSCRLVHQPPSGFGLNYEEAMELMLWWNPLCQPAWTEKELQHKVLDAIKKSK